MENAKEIVWNLMTFHTMNHFRKVCFPCILYSVLFNLPNIFLGSILVVFFFCSLFINGDSFTCPGMFSRNSEMNYLGALFALCSDSVWNIVFPWQPQSLYPLLAQASFLRGCVWGGSSDKCCLMTTLTLRGDDSVNLTERSISLTFIRIHMNLH